MGIRDAMAVAPTNATGATPVAAPDGAQPPTPPDPAAPPASTPENNNGVFVTPASLTFPLAGAVASTILQVVARIVPGAATSVYWALGISVVLGAIIVYLSFNSTM